METILLDNFLIVKREFQKLVLDSLANISIILVMNKKLPFKVYDISFAALVAEWRRRRAADMIRLHNAGLSYSEIGEVFGVSRQYVGKVVKQARELQ